jgi:hypothetical protein
MFSDTDKDSHKCGGNDSVNGLPFYYDPSDFHVDKLNVAITLVRRRIGSDVAIFSLYDSRRPQTVSYRVGKHTPLLEMTNLPFIVARLLILARVEFPELWYSGKTEMASRLGHSNKLDKLMPL